MKQALLKEYFAMCKNLFKIRSVIAYHVNCGHDIVKTLPEDTSFVRMVHSIKTSLVNLFQGTKAKQSLLDDLGDLQDLPRLSKRKSKSFKAI